MRKDKISVIIPTYNREKYVVKSINSVLNQTYKNIEVIVVDDCSKDNTESVIKKIKDKRVKYCKLKENKGACYARNYGVSKSTGKYIAFQDSDDEFFSTKLEKQYNNLILQKSDFDFCKINICFNENEYEVPNEETINNFLKNGFLNELINGNFISTQSILCKKDILLKDKFDDEIPRLQDYDLVLRIIPKYKISFTNEALVNLYKYDNSIGSDYNRLKKTISIMSMKDYDISHDNKEKMINNILNIYYNDIESKLNEKHNLEIKIKDKEINDKEKYIKKLENIIIDKDTHIKNIESTVKQKNKYINDLENNNKKLNNDLNSILNSRRWKIVDKIGNIKNKIIGGE